MSRRHLIATAVLLSAHLAAAAVGFDDDAAGRAPAELGYAGGADK